MIVLGGRKFGKCEMAIAENQMFLYVFVVVVLLLWFLPSCVVSTLGSFLSRTHPSARCYIISAQLFAASAMTDEYVLTQSQAFYHLGQS